MPTLPVDSFQLHATRNGKIVTVRGFYITPSGGYTYSASTDTKLARLPEVLGATINICRPSRRLYKHPVRKPITFSIPDPQAQATHVIVLLFISGVLRRRLVLSVAE